ncbi:MAG: HD domain-containing protein, partial [Planctomycetota bacterium]|nr:HD domain-containing protein [Planctomycetota bacterium]
ISDHILSTCHLVLALGPKTNPPLNTERALALAIIHDAPEALTGDLPRGASERLPAAARGKMDRDAAQSLLEPISALALTHHSEYMAGQTREARLVKLCDKLQLGVRLVAYGRAGIRGLDEFREGLETLDALEFSAAEDLRLEILAELESLDRHSPSPLNAENEAPDGADGAT